MEPNKKLSEEELERIREIVRGFDVRAPTPDFTWDDARLLLSHISALTAEIEARDALIDTLRNALKFIAHALETGSPLIEGVGWGTRCHVCESWAGNDTHAEWCPFNGRAQSLGIVEKD